MVLVSSSPASTDNNGLPHPTKTPSKQMATPQPSRRCQKTYSQTGQSRPGFPKKPWGLAALRYRREVIEMVLSLPEPLGKGRPPLCMAPIPLSKSIALGRPLPWAGAFAPRTSKALGSRTLFTVPLTQRRSGAEETSGPRDAGTGRTSVAGRRPPLRCSSLVKSRPPAPSVVNCPYNRYRPEQ
jgi:hypothetical protein